LRTLIKEAFFRSRCMQLCVYMYLYIHIYILMCVSMHLRMYYMYICVFLFIYIHVCILRSLLALEVGEELIAHRIELRIFFSLLLDLYTTHTHTVSDAFDRRVLHVKAAGCAYTHTNTHAHETSTPCLRHERFHLNTLIQDTFV